MLSAEGTLEKVPAARKKDYISKCTWHKIEGRNVLLESGDADKRVGTMNKEIKKKNKMIMRLYMLKDLVRKGDNARN